MVHFRSGRHEKAWNKNVFAIGNAYAFIEPLESTAIQTASHSIMALCRLMPNSVEDHTSIAGLNADIAATWDTFRWFLGMHYKFNDKIKSPFWDWCRQNTEIGDAKDVIELFKERAPLSAGNFGTATQYNALPSLVFNSNSYDTLLFGQKVLPREMKPPRMSREEYFSKVGSYQELTKNSLSLAELFEGDHLFKAGILEDLFNDPDTWIQETDV
jgi:tryptophan halogenase